MEKLWHWAKAHPYEAGGVGLLVGLIILWWFGFFSSSSSSSNSDLAAYYNAQAQAAAAGEQQTALQDQLQAASTYYSTQAATAQAGYNTQLQIAQTQANAQTQAAQIAADAATTQAQLAEKAAIVTSRQATALGVAQSQDALTAAMQAYSPAVLGSMNYQAFLSYLLGSGGGSASAQGPIAGNGPGAISLATITPGAFGAPGQTSANALQPLTINGITYLNAPWLGGYVQQGNYNALQNAYTAGMTGGVVNA